MIKRIIKGIMKLMINLVSLLLSPIDNLLTQFFPDISNLLSYIGSYFQLAGRYIGWVIDASFISQEVISILIAFYTFKLTFWIGLWGIKTAIKWYDKLKL